MIELWSEMSGNQWLSENNRKFTEGLSKIPVPICTTVFRQRLHTSTTEGQHLHKSALFNPSRSSMAAILGVPSHIQLQDKTHLNETMCCIY